VLTAFDGLFAGAHDSADGTIKRQIKEASTRRLLIFNIVVPYQELFVQYYYNAELLFSPYTHQNKELWEIMRINNILQSNNFQYDNYLASQYYFLYLFFFIYAIDGVNFRHYNFLTLISWR